MKCGIGGEGKAPILDELYVLGLKQFAGNALIAVRSKSAASALSLLLKLSWIIRY